MSWIINYLGLLNLMSSKSTQTYHQKAKPQSRFRFQCTLCLIKSGRRDACALIMFRHPYEQQEAWVGICTRCHNVNTQAFVPPLMEEPEEIPSEVSPEE